MFPSHSYPLSTIQWRTAEDYLVFGYTDETAYVWQVILERTTPSGYLNLNTDGHWLPGPHPYRKELSKYHGR